MIQKVFILGNHIQALGLARQVSPLGISVYLFLNNPLSIAKYSKYTDKTFLFNNHNDLLDKVLSLNTQPKTILLFPTNDDMVCFLHVNHELLSKTFLLGIPSPSVTDIFYNKRKTYQFATSNNIPIPESWYPDNIEDVATICKKVEYPVILKPAVMHSFHKAFGKKAYKCNSREELMQKANWVSEKIPLSEIIIQEYLAGGAKTLYSYGTFSADGIPIVSLMANRIRQNPMDFGNSTTFAMTCNIPEIQKSAEQILHLTNYFGLAEIEFMFDEKSNKYKFLEINTRAWKWHSISNKLGFSFIVEMIRYLNHNATKTKTNFDQKIAWVDRLTDFAVFSKEIFKGKMKASEVLKSYMISKEYAVWDTKDLKPFFMYLLLAPYMYFKRH